MVVHPMQADRPPKELPESVALLAYEVYCAIHGSQPAMIDATRGYRGGFSIREVIAFLYARSFPRAEWERRADEAFAGMKP